MDYIYRFQDEIIGTAYLAAAYLEDIGFDKSKKVYVVGSTGITQVATVFGQAFHLS